MRVRIMILGGTGIICCQKMVGSRNGGDGDGNEQCCLFLRERGGGE